MSDDLVKWLRYCAPERRDCGRNELAMLDAADRIEQLEALLDEDVFSQTLFDAVVNQRNRANDRIEQLEAALREIAWIATPDHEEARHKATEIARKALEGKKDDR